MTTSRSLPDDMFVASQLRQPELVGPIATHERKQFSFMVLGEPRGQGRHRSTMMKGPKPFIRNYQKKEDVDYRNLIKLSFLQAMEKQDFRMPADMTPITAKIEAYFQIPASRSKRWKEAAADETMPDLSKPDCDNIAKMVLDALSGIGFPDDKQVYSLTTVKLYGTTPRTMVHLSWWQAKGEA